VHNPEPPALFLLSPSAVYWYSDHRLSITAINTAYCCHQCCVTCPQCLSSSTALSGIIPTHLTLINSAWLCLPHLPMPIIMEQPFNNYFSFCSCLFLFVFVDDIIKGQQHESDFILFYLCLFLFGLSLISYLLSPYLWLITVTIWLTLNYDHISFTHRSNPIALDSSYMTHLLRSQSAWLWSFPFWTISPMITQLYCGLTHFCLHCLLIDLVCAPDPLVYKPYCTNCIL